jgi:dipeptidyl aminopeptidase/acylaminoacyl peptidase
MIKKGEESLAVINPDEKSLSVVDNRLSVFRSIKTDKDGRVFFIGASSKKLEAICSIDINSESKEVSVIKKSSKLKMQPEDVSLPKNISYPTKDGQKAYAFLYLPKNSRFSAPDNEKPPLLVIAHGGPTSSTCGSFSFLIQFWTSSGFAVIDINYRGSTGYGRRYRDALLNQWGLIDAEDVADGVRYLIRENIIDPEKVAVRGGSAGGYMVQRVMTRYPQIFKVGASYYGIGDLITLVEQTHKFESRYIDNLIGAKLPEGKSEYKNRSPINHLDKLKAPMIIFQGSEDKIVIPKCSQEVAEKLKEKGIKYDYIEYKGEQHGFRDKKSKVDSLMREYKFYREVFATASSKKE